MNNREFDFIDMLSILSFALGYENLLENRQQSAQNNIGAANDAQAQFLLKNIFLRFDEQKEMLFEIQKRLISIESRMGNQDKE